MTKRNPCTYFIEAFDGSGQYLVKQERRGYAQERKTIDGVAMVFVMEMKFLVVLILLPSIGRERATIAHETVASVVDIVMEFSARTIRNIP